MVQLKSSGRSLIPGTRACRHLTVFRFRECPCSSVALERGCNGTNRGSDGKGTKPPPSFVHVMHAIFAGHDEHELVRELEAAGFTVHVVDGVANRPGLEEAGIVDADLFVLTDVGQATGIPVAKDLNPDVRVVVYSGDSLPEFVSGQADLAVDPALLDSATVAEELAAQGP
jgi:hypothetical protein